MRGWVAPALCAGVLAFAPARAAVAGAAPAGAGSPAARPSAAGSPAARPSAAGSPAAKPAAPANLGATHPLGSYERQALEQVLSARGLKIDPAPKGKFVGAIHVVNLDVFGPEDGFLQWFNLFHRTTREDVIRREVLLRPGELWDPALVEETERKLRNPVFSSLVVIVPVVPPGEAHDPRHVDLLVVTRDVWSLRANSSFEYQQGTFSKLDVQASENNLLGWRKTVAMTFAMDLGSYALGPLYYDTNIAGTHMQLYTRPALLFSRATSAFEGSESTTVLAYPLWSLEQKWGATLDVSHFDGIRRFFTGTQLMTYDDPATPQNDALPRIYRDRTFDLQAEVTRQTGDDLKQQFGFGYELDVSRPQVLSSFSGDAMQRADFVRDVLPRSARDSALFAHYRLFSPRYLNLHNFDTYGLTENVEVGPNLDLKVAPGFYAIGSENNFLKLTGSAGWNVSLPPDGVAEVAASEDTRFEHSVFQDTSLTASVKVASPTLAGALRVVARAKVFALFNTTGNSNNFLTLGGTTSLRGYPIGAFTGQREVIANLEVRSTPLSWAFLRFGGIVFYDAGHAAQTFDTLFLRQDAGIGIRFLMPQFGPLVYRIDWAFPLSGDRPALPGRITAGLGQVF